MSDPERLEAVAEEFHRVYLLTAGRLGWPIRPGVNMVYGHLAEDAKELDRALARWHLLKMDAAEKRSEEAKAARDIAVKALPDPEKLELLADWFDADNVVKGRRGSEVQADLRRWAQQARAAQSPGAAGEVKR